MPTGRRAQAGFTYIGLLLLVALFGLASVGAARILASTERAERETELLFVGEQFRLAIRSYLQSGVSAGQYPKTLDDLLLDQRYATRQRHLRKIFVDPVTGKAEWGLVPAPEGGFMGVHSLSEREPMKRANFEPRDANFAAAAQVPQAPAGGSTQAVALDARGYSYRDWQFVYRPPGAATPRSPLM